MKKICWVLPFLLLVLGTAALGQEHQFGIRVGNTIFGDPDSFPAMAIEDELIQNYLPPGCLSGNPPDPADQPAGCPGIAVGSGNIPLMLTGFMLNDAVRLDKNIDGTRTLLDFRRDFDPEEFEGNFIGVSYEWRRDTEAHFSLGVDAGLFSSDATHILMGNARRDDPTNSTEDPFDYDDDGNTAVEDIPALITDRMEYTQYFVNIVPRYNITTGKWRFWVGGGLGLWANLWREVVTAEFINVTCNPALDPTCDTTSQYRESDGDRRTIIPFLVSVGLHYQFLPHWSVQLEDRYSFSAEGNATLHRTQADYDVGGNQVILGFSYKL